jgi:L-alanine-DL-glutamate epimerase-like enolase superfamily enzyme
LRDASGNTIAWPAQAAVVLEAVRTVQPAPQAAATPATNGAATPQLASPETSPRPNATHDAGPTFGTAAPLGSSAPPEINLSLGTGPRPRGGAGSGPSLGDGQAAEERPPRSEEVTEPTAAEVDDSAVAHADPAPRELVGALSANAAPAPSRLPRARFLRQATADIDPPNHSGAQRGTGAEPDNERAEAPARRAHATGHAATPIPSTTPRPRSDQPANERVVDAPQVRANEVAGNGEIALRTRLGEAGADRGPRSAATDPRSRMDSMGKITSVRAIAVGIPLTSATRMATRLITQREFVLVKVSAEGTDEIGTGYSYAGTNGGALLANAVNQLLAPSLIGWDSTDIVGAYELLYRDTLLTGRRGAVLRAISAIDIALWDLLGRHLGVPLAVLLGGSARPVGAYASGGYYHVEEGYYRGLDGPWDRDVAREIKSNTAAGFSDHKIKVGGLSVADDARRVRAAIGALGEGGRLALDANNAYRTPAEALVAIRAFERAAGDTGLWWIEEPLSPDDPEGHAELARVVETPIATGEIAQTRHEFRQLLNEHAADILQPDAGVIGGVTEWIRVARAAEVQGIPVAPHWHANLHVHLAAASPNCFTIEHFALQKDIYNFERLLTPESRLVPADGFITVPDRPGLGIEFDPGALRRFALEP